VPLWLRTRSCAAEKPQALWNLTDDQARVTGHILWIMSVPMFYRSGAVHRFVGILNFDVVRHVLRHPERGRR